MTHEIAIKYVLTSGDGYLIFFRPCIDKTIDWKVRFLYAFFTNKKFLLCFLQDTVKKCFFSPANSIVDYPFTFVFKPQFLAAPKN